MSEYVDWAAMTDAEFLALARRAMEAPAESDRLEEDTTTGESSPTALDRRPG